MSHVRPASPRRLPALALVAVLLALAGVASSSMREHRAAGEAVRSGPDSVVSLSQKVSSAGWYCAGPLPIGGGKEGKEVSSIAVANAGGSEVSGELVVAASSGRSTTRKISLVARSQTVYALPRQGASRSAAATVLVNGGSVGVDEVVHGPGGPTVAPCTTHTSETDYLAPGGSEGADNVDLALYDPGATPAVASVSLSTSSGPVAPPSLQGLAVGAGSVAVVDLGRAAPGQALLASTVTSTGGRVAVGGLLTVARGHGVETSLLGASPAVSSSWTFPPVPAGPGTVEGISVLNPGTRPARVVLRSGGSGGGAAVAETVPAGRVVSLSPGNVVPAGATRWEQLSVVQGSGVVAARELALDGTRAAPLTEVRRRVETVRRRVDGRMVSRREVVAVRTKVGSPLTSLPALPAGFALEAGSGSPAASWLLAAGESDLRSGELVEVADPGARPAAVHLEELRGDAGGSPPALPGFTVPAGGSLTVSVAELHQLKGEVALVLTASQPVVASAPLYARGSARAIGFTTPLGLPIG